LLCEPSLLAVWENAKSQQRISDKPALLSNWRPRNTAAVFLSRADRSGRQRGTVEISADRARLAYTRLFAGLILIILANVGWLFRLVGSLCRCNRVQCGRLGLNIGRAACAGTRPRKVVGATSVRLQGVTAAEDFRRDWVGRRLRWVVCRPDEIAVLAATGG
jgi:hypothetical protein